jgi:hypothetical protein
MVDVDGRLWSITSMIDEVHPAVSSIVSFEDPDFFVFGDIYDDAYVTSIANLIEIQDLPPDTQYDMYLCR